MGRGAGGAAAPPVGKKKSIIWAKLVYCSGKDTVKNILLFNILIYLFSSRISPNLLTDLCTTSRDGCYYSEFNSENIEFCQGTGSDNQDGAGTGTAYELAAMLIYVSSRVHVRVIWWIEVCLCRSLVKDHIDTVQPRALLKGLSAPFAASRHF